MEKYKLIKEYPGSPELGTELTMKGVNSYHTPSKYPEYWERVSEEGYEILSIKVSDHYGGSRVLEEWTPENKISLADMLNLGNCVHSGHYYIHSVKRLSDGEVFTVGDYVQYKVSTGWVESSKSRIQNFILENDKIMIGTTTSIRWADLSETIRKIKQPLFTTEDGVDIYEGDDFYWVNEDSWSIQKPYIKKAFPRNTVDYKHYSTKEKAEEYILMNKPCLSLNDVNNSEGMNRRGFKYLKELVKSKDQIKR